ncbi:MAG: hypothetical protein SGJ09_17620 [Phycisphaerae bacterium]|nr:hypothetical protein [Phycisphaerae bacterium]
MTKIGITLSLSATIAALGLSTAALAVDVVQNDATVCGADAVDPNGGCNVAGNPFQDLGTLADGILNITGTCGTYEPVATPGAGNTTRDLDWFSFTLTQGRFVTFTLTTNFAAPNNNPVLFIGTAPECPGQPTFYATQAASPQTVSYFLDAGTYTTICSSPLEPTPLIPIYPCAPYTLSIEVGTTENTTTCNAASLPCGQPHVASGCDDYGCCEAVCAADPTCCSAAWDLDCVGNDSGGAVLICGIFIYTCNATGSSPANDCLTVASAVTLQCEEVSVAYNTTNAKTDGPSNTATGAASYMGKDVWYIVKVPFDGQLTVSACDNVAFDQVMEIYNLGTDATVLDPATLPAKFIGQVDDSCGVTAGLATLTLIDAAADNYYLIRVGGFDTDGLPATQGDIATGSGTIKLSMQRVIYTTGPQQGVITIASGALGGLGLSSGALSAAQPRRWKADAFTVGTAPGGGVWEMTQIIGKGFQPAGVTNTDLNWIIWNRTGEAKPVNGDQFLQGTVPYPAGYDNGIDFSANASFALPIAAGTMLPAGNYYLTLYASNPNDANLGAGTAPSNWAWFIYSKDGINLTAGGLHGWRSNDALSAAGFLFYNGLGTFAVQTGDDPNDLYNNVFDILGKGCGAETTPCPADVNNDGVVDASDLGIVLGGWGGAGVSDVNGNGETDASDLGILLGSWGPCAP